jgi:ferredoxin--NADP+ reductase
METSYNATITQVRRIHDELLILRLEPDDGPLEYLPGQYATLGLMSDEPHVPCEEAPQSGAPELIRRAYSFSHSPLDEQGRLVRPGERLDHEFYISLVRKSKSGRALLTPRIFRLEPGRRIFIGKQAHGTYTLATLPPDCNVLFAATGTGEAPHNAMIAELLAREHRGRIASLVCVRRRCDLAYAEIHRELVARFPDYRYVPLTTREQENLDATLPGFVGKQYVQDILRSPDVAARIGFSLHPENTHVFLCGTPDMIGLPTGSARELNSAGALAILQALGFGVDHGAHASNVHFERYF